MVHRAICLWKRGEKQVYVSEDYAEGSVKVSDGGERGSGRDGGWYIARDKTIGLNMSSFIGRTRERKRS